jgi:Putative Actinobacterial Holin-X, holin superfamily III
MARQQPEYQSNGRQGDLQVQRAADMPPRDTDERDMLMRDTSVRERSLGELFRDLTTETSALVTKEIALVKAEARQTGTTLARDSAKIGTAAALAFAGFLALTTFLIAGLGDLLNGKYWLSALIVGVLFFAIGYGMVKSAVSDMTRRGQSVKHTMDTVKDTGNWAKEEARQVKQELTS